MNTKTCYKCKETKPTEEYYTSNRTKDGFRGKCKECFATYAKEQRASYPEKFRLRSKARRDTHRDADNARRRALYRKLPKEYNVWQHMRDRCNRPECRGYHRYGGRGIKVCTEWDSFKQFYKDMGSRPTPKHQIDRIDNDGDYTPENCRWVTPAVNSRNSTAAKLTREKVLDIRRIHAEGNTSYKELADVYGVVPRTISSAIKGITWNLDCSVCGKTWTKINT